MDIRIDYLTYTEQVNISNDSTDKAAWKSLYSFICDYLPMSVVSYSDWSITFPWRYFLSIKGFVGQYLSARHNQYRVVFTDNAKSMLKAANDTSYNTALALNARSEAEIKARLESIGFKRSLTINQLNNLKKISHLPGAATFSVPGAGKTTEALAFFFVNATDIDRLLVVAPKNAFSAWDEQLDACMGENYGKFVRLRGGEAAIQIALRTNPRFMLITYDQLSRVKNTIVFLLHFYAIGVWIRSENQWVSFCPVFYKSQCFGASAAFITEAEILMKPARIRRYLISSAEPSFPLIRPDIIYDGRGKYKAYGKMEGRSAELLLAFGVLRFGILLGAFQNVFRGAIVPGLQGGHRVGDPVEQIGVEGLIVRHTETSFISNKRCILSSGNCQSLLLPI